MRNLRPARREGERMITVSVFLVLAAGITAVVSAMGKCPLWVSVILLCLFCMLQVLPK
jgi:hypothetical protein